MPGMYGAGVASFIQFPFIFPTRYYKSVYDSSSNGKNDEYLEKDVNLTALFPQIWEYTHFYL